MLIRVVLLTVVFVCIVRSNKLIAQDIHFSQIEYAPLNLNPGLSGAHSVIQTNINYRSQWSSVTTAFNTIGVSIDGRLNETSTNKKGIIAAGLNLFSDASGTNSVSTTKVNLNLAYHLLVNSNSKIGLGLYSGFGQRSIGISNAQWGSQYLNGSYDSNYGTAEAIQNNQFIYFDAGAGAVYTYNSSDRYINQNKQRMLNAGLAVYHVNRPIYSFINANNEQLQMRWSGFINGVIEVQNSKGALAPGLYWNKQGPSSQIMYGSYFRISMVEASKYTGRIKAFIYHIGLFHRWNDAIIIKNILEWHTLSVGFSYDVNVSSLSRSSNLRGGFELFLKYSLQSKHISRSRIN